MLGSRDSCESFNSSYFYRATLVPGSKFLVLMEKFSEIKSRDGKQSAGINRLEGALIIVRASLKIFQGKKI